MTDVADLTPTDLHCNFCGRPAEDVEHIVVASDMYASICNRCLDMCAVAIEEQMRELTPKEPVIWSYGSMGEYMEAD